MVYVTGMPTQVPIAGVTEMVAMIGELVGFVAVNIGLCPVPLAARPIAVFELDQVYVAPAGLLVMLSAAIDVPEHAAMLAGAVITGKGVTVMV